MVFGKREYFLVLFLTFAFMVFPFGYVLAGSRKGSGEEVAGEKLLSYRSLLEIQKQEKHSRLDRFFEVAGKRIGQKQHMFPYLRVIQMRLLRFNEKRSLRFLMNLSRDENLPPDVRQLCIGRLRRLDTNWGQRIMDEWQESVLLKTKVRLSKTFADKVNNRKEFTYDLSTRLSDEEIPKAIRLQKETSFSSEIENLVNFEVPQARDAVLTLLRESKNPYARKNCLSYFMHLYAENSVGRFATYLDDSHEQVRVQAIRALARVANREAIQILVRRIEEPKAKSDEEMALIHALGSIGSETAAKALLHYCQRRLQDSGWKAVLGKRALRQLGKFDQPDVVEYLISVAEKRRIATAYWSLALTDHTRAIEWLGKHIQSEQSSVYLAKLGAQVASGGIEVEKRALEELAGESYKNLNQWQQGVYVQLLCRGVVEKIPDLLAFIGSERVPEQLLESWKTELVSRSDQIEEKITSYLKDKTLKNYRADVEIGYWCFLASLPQTKESMELLQKAYHEYSEGTREAVTKYAELRKAIALHISEIGRQTYSYTFFRAPTLR